MRRFGRAPLSHPVQPTLSWRLFSYFCLMLSLAALSAAGQQIPEDASLTGTVRDARGPVSGASLRLKSQDADRTYAARTDAQGKYHFPILPAGPYVLHAEAEGYSALDLPPVFVSPKEVKTVDFSLQPASASSTAGPRFYDEPQFNVAGVTDATSLGGHGSDVIVRTRDRLAKDTASLAEPRTPPPTAEATAIEQSLRQTVKSDPSNFEALHRLGHLLLVEGKAREALVYSDHAAKLRPEDYENAYDQALANARAGNYNRARAGVKALMTAHDNAELHHLLADINEKSDDPLEAVRQYQRAAELDPTEPYFFDWGSELLLHHAPEPALQVFTKASRLFPRSERILMGLGAAWFARGGYDQAVQHISEASDLNPGDPAPYLFLGRIQQVQDASAQHIVDTLHRFVTLQPQNPEANYFYAVALWKFRKDSNQKPDPNIELFLTKAVTANPRYAAAHLQMGILRADAGEFSGAATQYEAALKIDPQLEEGHYRLAQAYRQLGKPELAKEELRLYDQCVKESAKKVERERHEIRQFVYTLRDQPSAPVQ